MKRISGLASLAVVAIVTITTAGSPVSPRDNKQAVAQKVFALSDDDQKQNPKVQDLSQWPMECEGAAARLDFAVIDTKKIEGGYLIVIARLGDGELSNRLNQIRLSVIEEYILRRGSDLKYVLAQGTRVKGLGRVEVYVGGRLQEIMPYKKNAKTHCIPGEG